MFYKFDEHNLERIAEYLRFSADYIYQEGDNDYNQRAEILYDMAEKMYRKVGRKRKLNKFLRLFYG